MYNLLGVQLKSPIIIGSGPLSYSAEGMRILSDAGAGAVVTKTIRKERAINPAPHMVRSTNNSLINNEKWTDFEPERWINEELPKLKKMGVITIASVGHTLEESSELVEKVEKAGADIIELVSYDYTDLIPMVKDTKNRVKIPVIAKLPPMIENIGDFCKELEEAGVDAITACDSVGPAFRIDIETGRPLLGGNGFGWLTGEVIKPITLHKIYEIRKKVKVPIIGLGGCMSGADAVEMVMAGANFIGVCTAPILRGESVIGKIFNDFKAHLERLGYNSIEEACGVVHQHMGDVNERIKFEFMYNEEKCTRCSLCVKVCAYKARTLNETMELDEEECRYCGLCVSVCPTKALEVSELQKANN
ncbi:4Fe-4S binding protein [Tissierella carlieri]|jgi:dihydroorotate dehydrogenase subfamily 1|uniref:4Fe-4S binding protein n=1 Tax=Tissierella TaxID=41273 RepID=UPI00307155DB